MPASGSSAPRNFVESTSSMPSSPNTRATAPIRAYRAENFIMLHLPGHHRVLDAVLMQQLNCPAELPEAHPVQTFRDALKPLRRLFANRNHRHFDPAAARPFQHQKWEIAISRDQTPARMDLIFCVFG